MRRPVKIILQGYAATFESYDVGGGPDSGGSLAQLAERPQRLRKTAASVEQLAQLHQPDQHFLAPISQLSS